MKNLLLILALGLAGLLYAKIGGGIVSEAIDPNTITVKSTVTYSYETKLPDGTTKQIESPTLMTSKQVQAQAAVLYQADIDRLKAIDVQVEAMTVKGTVKVPQYTWVINGKVVGIYQRVTLPDGTTQELKSDKSLTSEEWLAKAKTMYKAQIEREL